MRREVGLMRNWCSGVVTAIVAGTVAVWLAMPVIDSMHAGTRDQVSTESQAMIVYLAADLVLLAVCRWVDGAGGLDCWCASWWRMHWCES